MMINRFRCLSLVLRVTVAAEVRMSELIRRSMWLTVAAPESEAQLLIPPAHQSLTWTSNLGEAESISPGQHAATARRGSVAGRGHHLRATLGTDINSERNKTHDVVVVCALLLAYFAAEIATYDAAVLAEPFFLGLRMAGEVSFLILWLLKLSYNLVMRPIPAISNIHWPTRPQPASNRSFASERVFQLH